MSRPKKGTTFWMRVEDQTKVADSGCHEFIGCKDTCGYGRINRGKRLVRIHREVWGKVNGDIKPGMCVCHKCDNPSCINIDHLYLGTHQDNMRDKAIRKRVTNAVGEKKPAAKLKAVDIPVIRKRILGGETCYSIAREYGVSGEAILNIKHKRAWNND